MGGSTAEQGTFYMLLFLTGNQKKPVIGAQDFIRIRDANCLDPPIGAQDSNQLSENWRPGNQGSGNEQSIYMKLLTGFQIGILRGAESDPILLSKM
jgi:hypothetical protein